MQSEHGRNSENKAEPDGQHKRNAERIYSELMKRLDHSNSYVREQVQTFQLKKPLPGLRTNYSYEKF